MLYGICSVSSLNRCIFFKQCAKSTDQIARVTHWIPEYSDTKCILLHRASATWCWTGLVPTCLVVWDAKLKSSMNLKLALDGVLGTPASYAAKAFASPCAAYRSTAAAIFFLLQHI
jgi:hypothetical protein